MRSAHPINRRTKSDGPALNTYKGQIGIFRCA